MFRFQASDPPDRHQKECRPQMGWTTEKIEPRKYMNSNYQCKNLPWKCSGIIKAGKHMTRAKWGEKESQRVTLAGKHNVHLQLLWPITMKSLDPYVWPLGAHMLAFLPHEMVRLLCSCCSFSKISLMVRNKYLDIFVMGNCLCHSPTEVLTSSRSWAT